MITRRPRAWAHCALFFTAFLPFAAQGVGAQEPRPAPTHRAWSVQATAAHVEGNPYLRSPAGGAVRGQWPLGRTPYFVGVGGTMESPVLYLGVIRRALGRPDQPTSFDDRLIATVSVRF